MSFGFEIKNLVDRIIKFYSGYVDWWPYFEDKSEIIISAILTQNTSWKNVIKSLNNLRNLIGSLKIEEIVRLQLEDLEMLFKPSGFQKSKSKTIISISNYILKNYKTFKNAKNHFRTFIRSSFSFLEKLSKVKEFRNELLKIKGIGKETADSILLYSFELPSFVIDSYTVRIINRTLSKNFNKNSHYDYLKNQFEINIISNLRHYLRLSSLLPETHKTNDLLSIFTNLLKVLHAGFVEVCKNFCRKKTTLCHKCPIRYICSLHKKIIM